MSSATALTLDDLLDLQRFDAVVESKQALSRGNTSGALISRHRGHGLDFDDLRLYSPGDDVRHIDWKVTARYGEAHTRLYREERDSTVTTAVDLRQAMCTGTDSLRAVNAGLLSAAIAWQSARLGHRSAVLALTDAEIFSAYPQAGDAGALRVCRTLCDAFDAQQNTAASGATASPANPLRLHALLDSLIIGGRQLGAIVLLTGFDDHFDADLKRPLGDTFRLLQARHHRHAHPLCAIQIIDTLEAKALPAGRYAYSAEAFTSRLKRTLFLSAQHRSSLKRKLNTMQQEVHKLCHAHDIHCINHFGKPSHQSISHMLAELSQRGLFT